MANPSRAATNRHAAGGALIVCGGLIGFLGIIFASIGLIAGFSGSWLSGHAPGLVVLAQGAVLGYVGVRMIRAGRTRAQSQGEPPEK